MGRLVVIRGAGDMASATALRLKRSGFDILMCEKPSPVSIRRTVSFSECIWNGEMTIEGVSAVRVETVAEIADVFASDRIAVMVDPELECISKVDCYVLVDAILAKRNVGTKKAMAPLVIALGPGFEAGKDVHAVIETKRGHYLGMAYWRGRALKNTGIPGDVMGYSSERVMRAPCAGIFQSDRQIGESVRRGDVIAQVSGIPMTAKISGVLRGLLRDRLEVTEGFKCADIDPRKDAAAYIRTVSDKARAVSGGVLECIMQHFSQNGERRGKGRSLSLPPSDVLGCLDGFDSGNEELTDIYVDGSCNADASAIGYGVVVIRGNCVVHQFSGEVEQADKRQFRNIAGEIEASMFAMRYCLTNGIAKVRLFFDYSGLRDWCTGVWKCKNDLTREYKAYYDSIKNKLEIVWMKVESHSGNRYNELADKLAKKCFEKHAEKED